jgi:PKD repeat protein
VLRGSVDANGKPATKIIFSGGGFSIRASSFSETTMNTEVNLAADANKGDTTINVGSTPSWVVPGQLYILDELDDPTMISAMGEQGGAPYRTVMGNGARGKGQLIKVVSTTASTVTFELPLMESYRVSQTAQLAQSAYNPTAGALRRAGAENIRFEYAWGSSGAQGILMQNCDGCWMKNVEGYNCPGTYHVWTIFSYRCEIDHSYFGFSHFYGGGQGYGIALYHYNTGCLYQDNIFQHLHCSMQVNYCSSGNVFAYNYCYDGYSDAHQEPSISAHGVSSWQSLFEGNFCQNKLLWDFTHGTGGTHSTAFRNRIQGLSAAGNDQVPISIERYDRQNNIIGNVLGVAGTHTTYAWVAPASCSGGWAIYRLGYYININCDSSTYDNPATLGTIIHGNYDVVNNGVVWDSTIADHNVPNSYYLANKPAWFGNRPWPPFDPTSPSTAVITNIPAGYRAVFGTDPPSGGPVNLAPTVVMNASSTNVFTNQPVNFTSTGSVDPEGVALSYSWNFGDGSTSTAANPSHSYTTAGLFTAQLTVSDGVNTASQTMSIRVRLAGVNTAPTASASSSVSNGPAPLTVTFSSAGSSDPEGTALTYSWNFGDSGTSTAANPSHAYSASGVYSARLTVSDGTNSAQSGVITISVGNTGTGLQAAYGFEEGSGTMAGDVSGKSNSGSISGANWSANGKFGKALSFGSGSIVTVNDSTSLDLTGAMTLEAWVYPTTLNGSWMNLIFKPVGDPANAAPAYVLQGSSSSQAPSVYISPASANLTAPTALTLNKWSHIATTYDGTTLRLYVDGALVNSMAQTGTMTTSSDPLTIGGNAFSGQNWAGLIDEVRIYNRALSSTEIQRDMNTPVVGVSGAPASPQGLKIVPQ